jgi:poly(3-hydroxybutyrate) depolymerase
MYDITAYHEIADREGFVVVYPDGALGLGPWNVGEEICGSGALVMGFNDDQAFIDEIIKFVDQDRCLDRDHIFVTGFSMGGYFSNEVGCLRSDIAAIGPHSGGTHPLTACTGDIKPVIIFHFRDDVLISYDCGAEAAQRWVERNGCNPAAPEVRTIQGGTCEYFQGCPVGAQVAFCSFEIPADGGGTFLAGHGWAGGTPNLYSVVGTASASDIGWEFFKEYAW